MVKVTTFLAVLCFPLVLGLGQVLALTWDFDKEADVEDWEGLQTQRKTCKWTIDLKGGVFQTEGLANEGAAFVKETVWNDDWVDYILEVKVRNMGTRKTKVVFELNPKEAPAIRFAFEMYLNGRGGLQIADQLNQQGYKTRGGNPISKSGVLNWFRRPFAFAGARVWNVSFWQKNAAGKQSLKGLQTQRRMGDCP